MAAEQKLILLFCLLLSSAAFGIGIGASPGTLVFKDLMRGGYAERGVSVSNPDDTPIEVNASMDGDIAGWLSLSSSSFTVEPKSSHRLVVYAKPPAGAQNGVYNGTITLVAAPKGAISSGMGAVFGAGVTVLISIEVVGEQKLSGRVNGLKSGDAEVGGAIPFFVSFTNNGNVAAKPVVRISLLDGKGDVAASQVFADNAVLPTKTEEIRILFPAPGLAAGQYWAEAEVSLGGEKLPFAGGRVSFDVLEKGALKANGELRELRSAAWAGAGDAVRIDAQFANTGETVVAAKFRGEVRLGEKVEGLLESDELEVAPGENVTFTIYFTPKEAGRYVAEGAVIYSKKTTERKSTVINVKGAAQNATVAVDAEKAKAPNQGGSFLAAALGGTSPSPLLVAIPCALSIVLVGAVALAAVAWVAMRKER